MQVFALLAAGLLAVLVILGPRLPRWLRRLSERRAGGAAAGKHNQTADPVERMRLAREHERVRRNGGVA